MQTISFKSALNQRVYVPTIEEILVTFQIGLFCPEGMVLAGDTKSTEFGTQKHLPDHAAIGWSTTTSKFRKDDELKTVIAISGGRSFDEAARALLEKWDTAHGQELINIAQAPFRNSVTEERGGLIVVRARERKMFRFVLGGGTSLTEHTSDKIIQGDCTTSAVLIVEHYADLKHCSLAKLKEIAALTVWLTGQLNPRYVSGLEMVEFPDGKLPRVLTANECGDLEKNASCVDASIQKLIMGDEAIPVPNFQR
jgi:hypothetical protein